MLETIATRVAIAALLPSVGAAQMESPRIMSSVDLSSTNVWYADTIRSSGASLSPAFRLDWARATLGGSASFTRLASGGTNVQGALAPSMFTPAAGPFTGELAGSLGGSTHQDGARTGQVLAVGRIYVPRDSNGFWAGAGLGRMWDGVVWRSMRLGEAGAWIDRAGTTALATFTPVVVQDTIRYADIQAALRYPAGAFELGVTAGSRLGASGPAVGGNSRAWGNVSVLAWLSARLAIVGNGGNYPVDLTQGYPGGRFFSVALRVASRNARTSEVATQFQVGSDQHGSTRVAGAMAFEVQTPQAGATRRLLRVYAPSARVVEMNADFTRWQPVLLTRRSDGWWSITRQIAAGTYQMNLRIDGGAWLAPPGLLTTRDEFGGAVGILTIE